MKNLLFPSLFLLLVLTGCQEKAPPLQLELPPTPLLTAETQWGVANKPYQRVLAVRKTSGIVSGVLRRGDIVEILSTLSAQEKGRYWLQIKTESFFGWVRDADIDIYDSSAQAQTARKSLLGSFL